MEEIFKQYSTPIIIAIVIVALIAIFVAILASNGYVAEQFETLITNFFAKANLAAAIPGGM